jgi:Flp pilus assembly protein TadD
VALFATVFLLGCQSANARKGPVPRQDTATARSENDRAYELIREGKHEKAEEALKRAIAADVMYGPARNNLGLVYYHLDKLYAAAWEFENAIKLMPHQPEPRNNLGLVLEKAGKIDGAADAYAKAREMEPDNPEFLGNLARARLRRGDRDEETHKLLEELVLKDDRPDWREWAQMNLLRLRQSSTTTRPAS